MTQSLGPLRRDILFLLFAAAALLATGAVLRGLLVLYNMDLASRSTTPELLMAFVTGARFDLMVASYFILPMCLLLILPWGLGRRRLARWWLAAGSAVMVFLGIVELDFYREFHTRLNSLVFEYLREYPETVIRMLWAGFPVTRYLLMFAAIWCALQWVLGNLNRVTAVDPEDRPTVSIYPKGKNTGETAASTWQTLAGHGALVHGALVIVTLLVFTAGARGSLQSGPPLRWGDAFTGEHVFSNHLGLNGTFTLIKAISAAIHSSSDQWWRHQGDRTANLALTRQLVLTDSDQLLGGNNPLLRRHAPNNGYAPGTVDNLVVIVMESFAGAYVGALGDNHGVTPAFDQLARQGLLFEHFFANGTHTHQGMFASLACFPNLPGHEYLMQQPEGAHGFSGLPELFHPESSNNVYVYNGDFRWDNQEGFFRNQGMDRFIGRDQIDQPKYVDAVWGVSDEDVFHQSVGELDKLADQGPFYAVIQTLSNHTPFELPEPLPVAVVTDGGAQSEHLTAMRYSDWALGQFFAAIADKSYYSHTAFVIVGDHGFGSDEIHSAVDLNRFRVPLLLIAPGIREHYGARSQMVASQVDIVPTVMGLLGKPFVHQCWGRDLLSVSATDNGDQGYAVIKPSGSDKMAAIIDGRDILTLTPGEASELGNIDFNPRLTWHRQDNPARAAQLQNQLQAFIQTGLLALSESRTGLSTGTATD